MVRALRSRGASGAFHRDGEGGRAPRGPDGAGAGEDGFEPVVRIRGGAGAGEVGVQPVVLFGGRVRCFDIVFFFVVVRQIVEGHGHG